VDDFNRQIDEEGTPPPANPGVAPMTPGAAAIAVTGRLRTLVRSNELILVAIAIVVGSLAGLCVTLMSEIAQGAHVAIFGIALDERLSATAKVKPLAALVGPIAGGMILGLMEFWRRRRKIPSAVDPIEANALRGGRMSPRDSLVVSAQTIISNGSGASVGLEAGYTQIGAGMASLIGLFLRLRRQDMRMLVGCGAAGAIAGSFGAPLTGAFYAFELIVGAYSLSTAGPIFAASLAAVLTTRALGGSPYSVTAPQVHTMFFSHYLLLIALGMISAALGIAAMRAAALAERVFESSPLPQWSRPMAGGLLIGLMALATPQVLAAGHGALSLDIPLALSAIVLLKLIGLKLAACLLSLASGFRGGLFFASLFVGALLGKLFAIVVNYAAPWLDLDSTACILAGMGTLGVSIVGGPLTMSFLVLESTANFGVTAAVLAACIATSLAVRATFGYSFSTWRLHLRGENIRSANDVGWIRDLIVERLMSRNPPTTPAEASVHDFRIAHPLGSSQVVVAIDQDGRYRGIVSVPEVHALLMLDQEGEKPISDYLKLPRTTLYPDMNVKSAMSVFDDAQTELLAVVNRETGAVAGLLGEAYAARRYAEESDRAAQGVLGGG
jgi:CIC family chloride channel protein